MYQFSEKSFKQMDYDVVNMHPLSNMWHKGKNYDLGMFMRGSLHLRQLRDYCLAVYSEQKPLNFDEDNAAARFMDVKGWTIHRKRAWTTLMCGSHYDVIDFSINKYVETGTEESQKHIRIWMKYLSEFIHSIDLVHAKPLTDWLKKVPDFVCASILAVDEEDYCIYLADERESKDFNAGSPIAGSLVFDLPQGDYEIGFYSPTSGSYHNKKLLAGGNNISIQIPSFEQDTVVRMTKGYLYLTR